MGGRGTHVSTPAGVTAAPAGPAATPRDEKPRDSTRPPEVKEPELALSDYESIYTDSPVYKEYIKQQEERFADKLTDAQRTVLLSYKGSGYVSLNRELRGQAPITKHNQDKVRVMDEAFKNTTLGRNLVLYRGFSSSDKHEVGAVIRDNGFMSTSLNPNGAFSGSTMLRIHAPAKTRGAYIESQRTYNKYAQPGKLQMHEHEVLLARGTTYRVVGKSTIKLMNGKERELFDVVIVNLSE